MDGIQLKTVRRVVDSGRTLTKEARQKAERMRELARAIADEWDRILEKDDKLKSE